MLWINLIRMVNCIAVLSLSLPLWQQLPLSLLPSLSLFQWNMSTVTYAFDFSYFLFRLRLSCSRTFVRPSVRPSLRPLAFQCLLDRRRMTTKTSSDKEDLMVCPSVRLVCLSIRRKHRERSTCCKCHVLYNNMNILRYYSTWPVSERIGQHAGCQSNNNTNGRSRKNKIS